MEKVALLFAYTRHIALYIRLMLFCSWHQMYARISGCFKYIAGESIIDGFSYFYLLESF